MKVAIVNDSRMAAEILRRILADLHGFTLIWTAYSGEEAIRLCQQSRPDIILMDLIMPGIDGAETTRRIMKSTPCVILVVTATTVGNRDKVFEAMGYGALDAVNTPVLAPGQEVEGAGPLIRKLNTVSRLVNAHNGPAKKPSLVRAKRPAPDSSTFPVVAFGASTGGPQALAEVLSHLPAQFPAVVLVVQHVDGQFAPGLAAWLQHSSQLPVSIAREGEPLLPGTVWIAGSDRHLLYENGAARYISAPESAAHSPSIDVLFSSLAQPHRAPRIGVLLTGMGRDGADGLLALRNSGALTIAQDQATSVVYGMPKAAAELHAATEILPLGAIAPRICDAILHPSHHPMMPAAQKTESGIAGKESSSIAALEKRET
ncbi:MAG TPA: chemotaxis-specific protein-glutamate methyltransferase CheB [Terracidiphilus sp.]|jgi:two-component system response regulator WspF|nr:chemotaxis-specific protein-glutamate methyltransferase CheB [Terracidiphilus sp.]